MRVYVQSIVLVLVEIILYQLFMEAFCDYQSREHRKRRFLMVGIIFVVSLPATFLISNYLFKQILLVGVLSFVSGKFYDAKPFKLIAITLICFGMMIAIEYIALMIHTELFRREAAPPEFPQTPEILLVTLIEFFIVLVIRRITVHGRQDYLANGEWLNFLFVPAFSICIYAIIESNAYVQNIKEYENLLWIIALGILGANILLFYLMQNISKREFQFHRNKLAETKEKNQLMFYQSLVENYDRQNQRLHEYKNQIECLRLLCQNGNYKELERYLNQIGGELSHKLDAVDTHHTMVNVILNSKYQEATGNGIIMVLRLDDLSGLWLNEHDIVVILANLLDNAIEACKKLEGRRVIKIKMLIEKSGFILSVRNTYDGTVKRREGELLSTKDNADHGHGIGVKNIIRIVEKYGGNYSIETQDTEFVFSILIPKPVG